MPFAAPFAQAGGDPVEGDVLEMVGVGAKAFAACQVAWQVDQAVGLLGETVLHALVHAAAHRGAVQSSRRGQARDVGSV